AATDVKAALDLMNRPANSDCDECKPKVQISSSRLDGGAVSARLYCSRNTNGGSRVAFVFLHFSQNDASASISDIELVGSVATLDLKQATEKSAYPVME